MLRNYLPLLSLLFLAAPLFSQQELGLHFLRDNWHANETNPAIVRDQGGVFRLPGVYNGLAFDGPSYSQLVTKVNGEPIIDVNTVITHLNDENILKNDFELQTLGFAVAVKKHWVVSFGHSVKYHAYFKYPKELAQVAYQGNAQFIGQTVDIGNEIQLSGFHSVDFGLAYRVKGWTIGAKAKFLSGFVDMTTDDRHASVNLYTDPDIYQITLEGDYILNTSNALEYRSYDDFDFDLNFGTFTADRFFDGNTGWAFDVGVHYETDKWDFAASVLNLGNGITWQSRVTNYIIQDSYEYNGLDFSGALTGGDSPNLDATLDSLEQIFQPEEAQNAYTNNVPRRIYISGLYKASPKLNVGAVFFNEEFRGVARSVFGIHTNYDLAKWFNVGLTYSATEGSFDNLGTSLTLQGKSFQLFGVTDNIIDLVNPTQGNAFAIRLGGNLFF